MDEQLLRASAASPYDDRREQLGWCFYDWACTAFTTSVISLFLGPYLTALAKAAADREGRINPLGIQLTPGAFFPAMVSLSVLLQLFCLPVLGAVADSSTRKKRLWGVCAYLGAGATMSMYILQGTMYILGGVLLVIGNLAFGAAILLSNSFLPAIASPAQRNRVSTQSWALGFLGGGLLLLLTLGFYTQRQAIGLTDGQAVRICLAAAGLWWGSLRSFRCGWSNTARRSRLVPAA
jgi:MFS transporter, UMF1 family